MAQVWLGGGLFVLEAALTGMTLRSDSPSQVACALAVGLVGAVPTACKLAAGFFGNESATAHELPVDVARS